MRILSYVGALVALTLAACTAVEPTRLPSPPVTVFDRPEMHATVRGVLQASGWALHPQGPIKRIDLLLDGRAVGAATYGLERPDVCDWFIARPACPNVGWEGTIDVAQAAPGEHQLRLRVTGPFGEQTETPPHPFVVEAGA